MDIATDSYHARRLEIVETGRRRRWSLEKKLEIVGESLAGARAASATARRHGISNTLLFTWRKAFREGRLGGALPIGFAPAVIEPEPVSSASSLVGGRMEVVSANGRRIIVGPDVDAGALKRVLDAIERR
ncbi:MAG: IS66-like element accessory protein TnpA [Hyphomicrobiales bacterium]